MNRFKQAPKPKAEEKKSPVKFKAARRYVKVLNIFGYIKTDTLIKVMPFIFYGTLLTILYIANSYMAEKTVRRIDALNKELKTLRADYISGKSELMFVSKQSAVAKEVSAQGVKESVTAPRKIIVSLNSNQEENN